MKPQQRKPEIWEKLPRDPRYRVSSHGRVRGVYGKTLATTTVRGGYLRVHLGTRKALVHRLVLEAFTGNCPPGFKSPDATEDLKKARFYIDAEIDRLSR